MAELSEYNLTGTAPSESDAPRLSRAMKKREALNTLMQFSGDSVLAPLGARRSKAVRDEANQVRQSALTRAREAAVQQRHDAQMAQQYQMHQERMAHDTMLARAKAAARKSSPVPKGLMDNLTGTAKRVTSLNSLLKDAETLGQIGSEGKMPFQNTAEMWAARHGMGSDQNKAVQHWWGRFKQEVEIAARHEVFGATLTGGEKSAWQAASAGEEMTTEQALTVLRAWRDFNQKENARYRDYAISTGLYDTESINTLAAWGTGEKDKIDNTPDDEQVTGQPKVLVEGRDF